jgi:NAD(P)-dependent dehydrogenase (short-subunit alcohol dehydrogenase family)
MNIIILGVSADIGANICKKYLNDGFNVIGTYRRNFSGLIELEKLDNLELVKCDVTKSDEIQLLVDLVRAKKFKWTTIFSSIGSSEPIGRFFSLDFDLWEESVNINMLSQLRAIHALYPYRETSQEVNIALLAGGGTNNPFRCYSSYCVAKLGLIKMCELIDDEAEDVNAFILGPGFVKTKTHYETIKAGRHAENNFERVRRFMETEEKGTSFEDIYKCLRWAVSMGRKVTGGRNFSIVHDQWGTEELAGKLEKNINMYKLRRFGNN